MRQQIASAINLVVHVARLSDGSRRVMKITEISGMEGDTIMMQDLFEFVRTGTSPSGRIIGHFHSTGIRSSYHQRLEVPASGWTQNQSTQAADKPWKR